MAVKYPTQHAPRKAKMTPPPKKKKKRKEEFFLKSWIWLKASLGAGKSRIRNNIG
jgi:hypothetical protein